MGNKIKKGDNVLIISGEYNGDRGVVKSVLPKKGLLYIEGMNMRKKHKKPDQNNQEGGIFEKEAPIAISNVMLINPSTDQPTRVGIKDDNGKKVRYSKKSKELID